MKIRKNLFIVITGLLTILLIIAIDNGFFTTIQTEEKRSETYNIVGLEFTGSYSKVGKFMKEVEGKIKNMGISTEKGFGIYYDNPKIVKKENCRSFIGVILYKKDLDKIDELKAAGLKVDSIHASPSLTAEFPIKNSFSYMIGPWKAYPVLSKYMNKKKYATDLTMEIYDTKNRKIIFLIQYH